MATAKKEVKTVPLEKLTPRQATAFKAVLKEASRNKFLGTNIEETIPKRHCMVIFYGQQPVGFHAPKHQQWNGKDHWRAGTAYMLKSHQNKGIMKEVLEKFFATHQPALSWIEDTNTSSLSLFKDLGFVQDKSRDFGEGHPGHWYVREKITPATESLDTHCYSW